MFCTTASAVHARRPNNSSRSVTVSTLLLYHEWPLLHLLEACATTTSTLRWWSTRFGFCTFACHAHFSPLECHRFLASHYCIHEVNFEVEYDVLPFSCGLLGSFSSFTFFGWTSKHFFKFVKNITIEPRTLFAEASLRILFSKRVLCLLVTSDSCWVIYSAFCLITKGFVGCVNLGKAIFSIISFIDVGVKLLCKPEVGLLDVFLACVFISV